MPRPRTPRLTRAKAQRAMDALRDLIATGQLDQAQVSQIDQTCDLIRQLRDRIDA